MAFTVTTLARQAGDPVYYEPGFRTVIETHLPILRSPVMAQLSAISADKVHQYEADFYGLLSELGIPTDQHWIYLRVNRMMNPNEFGRQVHDPYAKSYAFDLILPPAEFIRELKTLYISTRR